MPGSLEQFAQYFRDVTVSRGFKYHFLAVEPQPDKPTLLFLHGFPSTSNDWHYQIVHFHAKGFGLIVPDLLAYGGTDKPLDPAAYSLKAMSQDVLDIVDSLSWSATARIIVVSHDWGAAFHCRLALYHQNRFFASVYLAVGGLPFTQSVVDFDVLLPILKKTFGRELLAYQEFFARSPDAAQAIEQNFDSVLDIMYPNDSSLWERILCVRGKMEDWIRNGKRAARGSWALPQDIDFTRDSLLAGGMAAPLNWYKASNDGFWVAEDQELSNNWTQIEHPALFIGATRDAVCIPPFGRAVAQGFHKNISFAELDTGHWIYLEQPDAVNSELDAFFSKIL
ncbi:alpha/beta-hydrolase [Auriculariales sp. MPI-PUGE-AT-0066]|nr:alpha/beta-hydrolase [Auriculariales sp. MPI-PUGE-AT-0066]